jgi:hypothetical protein
MNLKDKSGEKIKEYLVSFSGEQIPVSILLAL